MSDLITRLRQLSRSEHDDLSIANEAADEILILAETVSRLQLEVKIWKDEAKTAWTACDGAPQR